MGLRGAVEEAGPAQFPAITLAGVYDQYQDRWREPVNAPTADIRLSFDGKPWTLGGNGKAFSMQPLDYRHGIFSRETDFGPVRIRSRRFVSMAEPHLLADSMEMRFLRDGK